MSEIEPTNNVYTYVIVCDMSHEGQRKIKIGITENWKNRLRVYKLHNQNISDYIVFRGNYEFDILMMYRHSRIYDYDTNHETEWLDLDYNPIQEIKKEFNITNICHEMKRTYPIERHYQII